MCAPSGTAWNRSSGRSRSLSRCGPEVPELHSGRHVVLDELTRRIGKQHLPTVPGCADARRPMHAEADVALGVNRGLARMESHAHADAAAVGPCVRRKCGLSIDRGGDGLVGASKRDEEGVSLRADLSPAVRRERRAEERAMVGQEVAVAFGLPLQEARRPFRCP